MEYKSLTVARVAQGKQKNKSVPFFLSPFSGMSADSITADWVFDSGDVTWVGITPDDSETRNQEREKIQQLAKTDILAYINAMKEWGIEREKSFSQEGWRKMRM